MNLMLTFFFKSEYFRGNENKTMPSFNSFVLIFSAVQCIKQIVADIWISETEYEQ